jgi:hypothetical protein
LRWIGFSEDDAKINRRVIAGRKILLPEHRAHEKVGRQSRVYFSNALRTTRFYLLWHAKSIAPLLRDSKKNQKKACHSFTYPINPGNSVVKKIKKSLDAFLAFQLKPRLVSNSIYEKEIH